MTPLELVKNLKLALAQLQEYSENDLIIADGETKSIEEIKSEIELLEKEEDLKNCVFIDKDELKVMENFCDSYM
jgi:hypothetical protein